MEKNKPFDKIKLSNGIELVFWTKEILRGQQKIKMLDVSINKSWKNKEGKWEQRSINLNTNDLLRITSVGSQVVEIENKFKETKRQSGDIDEEEVM